MQKRKKKVELEESSTPPKLTPGAKSRPVQNENESMGPPSLPAQSSSDAGRGPRKESSRSRLRESPTVETIPEEDETALEQSWSAGTGRGEEEEEDRQKMSMSGERGEVGSDVGEKAVIVQEQDGETSGGSGANEEVVSLEQKADGDKASDGPNE